MTTKTRAPGAYTTQARLPEHKALLIDQNGLRYKDAARFARTEDERRLLRLREIIARARDSLLMSSDLDPADPA
jgi:hypothetical protein